MGFRFRKSIKILPGIKLNIGKKSSSISIGNKFGGISVNSKTGVTARTSIPGTGISFTEKVNTFSQTENNKPQTSTDSHAEYYENVQKISRAPKWEHIKFYADTPTDKVTQDTLYLFKMRKPPFDKGLTLTLQEEVEESGAKSLSILIKDSVVGFVPEGKVQYLNDNWDRVDAVSYLEVEGRRGTYDALVTIRLRLAELEPDTK